MVGEKNRGKKRTIEQRQRMSEGQKGRTFSVEAREKMRASRYAFIERQKLKEVELH